MNIKISLILPSLNVSDYIKEALDSARAQSLQEIEILCIDAGSTDGTWEILEKAAGEDPRIRLLKSEIRSYGYQVNLGIREAKGSYIAILETDDFVDPAMYERLYELAVANTADYAKADYDAFFTQTDGFYYFFPRYSFSDRSLYDRVIVPREHPEVGRDDWYLWQGLYARDFLIRNNIWFSESPGAAYQDIGFLVKTGICAERAIYSREILYHYRIDREAASSNSGKGLRFSYAEFRKLTELTDRSVKQDRTLPSDQSMDAVRDDRWQGDDAKRLLYARMAKSFVSCYSGISEAPEDVEGRREIYEWFCDQLETAIDRGWIDEALVQTGRWARLTALLDSEETYFMQYSETRREDGFLKGHDRFAIFGCGDFGFKAYKRICSLGKQVVLFMDNNETLWGKSLNGVKISRPEAALELPEETGIVIANEAYHDAIRKQLLELGVLTDKMAVYQ